MNEDNNIQQEELTKPKHVLRFKCFSDIHWKPLMFIENYITPAKDDPNLDAVFICGDLDLFDDTDSNPAIDAIKEKWPSATIFYVPGNHDRSNPDKNQIPFKCRNLDVILSGDATEPYIFKDVFKIYGSEYWECEYPWNINRLARNGMTDAEGMAECVKRIPEGLDILVTHTPAEVFDSTGGSLNARFGSHQLQLRLNELTNKEQQPKFHLFGHIHGSGGQVSTSTDTHITSINCAVLNEGYTINPSAVPVLLQTFELTK